MKNIKEEKKRINFGYIVEPTEFALSHLNYVLSLGFLENDRHFLVNRAYFPGYLIMSCISGKLWVEQYGYKVCVMPGESCLMNLQHPHKYYYDNDDPCSIVWIHFDGNQVNNMTSLIFEGQEKIDVIRENHLPILIRECIALYKKEGDDATFEISAIIYRALMIFMERSVNFTRGNFVSSLKKELNSYLEEHIGENITLKQMADICYLNPSYFCRRFLKETGTTPMKYLQRKRIERAKFFLLNTHHKIAYISQELGFYDQNHFSYQFKKETGMSPTEYRKQAVPFELKSLASAGDYIRIRQDKTKNTE